jgi:hypothetical protein
MAALAHELDTKVLEERTTLVEWTDENGDTEDEEMPWAELIQHLHIDRFYL